MFPKELVMGPINVAPSKEKECDHTYEVTNTSLNHVPNAQVCVYLMVNNSKLQLQTTFPKPLYIPHSACNHRDPGR
jgi:hypothetical protein